jgi:hypothetical protein
MKHQVPLMIETFTPFFHCLHNEKVEAGCSADGLNEEDSTFYNSIQTGLDKLTKVPASETIENILNYSSSL